MYVGIYVEYPLFLSYFNDAGIFSTDFEKPSNMTFNENPSNVGWVVRCGQTDIMKLIVAVLRKLATNLAKEMLIL